MKISSNVVGDSNDENNFPHKFLLTNTRVSRLGQLLKASLLLIKNVLKPLAKSVLIPLRLTTAVSATGASIHKKMFGSGMNSLIISNEQMNNIIKIIVLITFLSPAYAITRCISISALTSLLDLLDISVGIMNSKIGLKMCE